MEIKNKIKQLLHTICHFMKRPAGVHKKANIKWSLLHKNTIVHYRSLISVSKLYGNVMIGDHSSVVHCRISGDIKIGRYTSIYHSSICAKINNIVIGSFCSIASNCIIKEHNHIIDRCSTYYIFRNLIDAQTRQENIWDGPDRKDIESSGPIIIGNDVWIGAQVVILSGVTIGHGAVVGANSTVTRDVPPYAVVGGTPARLIKYRFPVEIIEKLLELSWWDWDEDRIQANQDLFSGPLTLEKLNCSSKEGSVVSGQSNI